MGILRSLLRVGILMLVSVAVFCALIVLFKGQVALNQYAELHMQEVPASPIVIDAAAGIPMHFAREPLPSPAGDGGRQANASGTDAIHTSNGRVDLPAVASASAREPVRANDSIPMSPQAAPATATNESGRAIAIRVGIAESVAEVAVAGRRVDVVLTHPTGSGSAFREVVLEDVQVLTIEPIAADSSNGERSIAHLVTLDIDIDSAQNLLLASQAGTLSLALHGRGDHQMPDTGRTAVPELATSEPAPVQDDRRFVAVTVNRIGGATSTHRVPRER